ncbi:MAG: AAA family ATPase [Stellaceae bacterium]
MAASQENRSPAPLRSGDDGFDVRHIRPLPGGVSGTPFAWPSDDLGFLAEILRTQHAPLPLIERLIAHAAAPDRAVSPAERLEHALGAHYRFSSLDDILHLPALLIVGPPGAGKTALVAKLTARLDPRRVLAVSVDSGNVAGLAQLEDYVKMLGMALAVAEDAAALRATVGGAERRTVVIDTPAAVAGDDEAEERLREFKAASGAEIVLALPADLDAAEAEAVGAWAGGLGAKLMIATRLDLVRRVGAVLAAADAGGLAPLAASLAPHFAYGIKALTPALLAKRILTGALDAERWQRR